MPDNVFGFKQIEKELNTGDGEAIQDEKPSEDGDKAEESIKP